MIVRVTVPKIRQETSAEATDPVPLTPENASVSQVTTVLPALSRVRDVKTAAQEAERDATGTEFAARNKDRANHTRPAKLFQ